MDAATIEEMNRIRQAMGLKLIPVPGAAPSQPSDATAAEPGEVASTIETREAAAYDNYKNVQAAEKAKKDREARAEAIKRAREKAQRFAVLEGKGLGDADDDDLDAKAWLKGQKKRQKKIEKERQKEQEAAAAAAAAAKEYSANDLAGVTVGHDVSTLLDGDEQVLTLKDTTVLEEDEGDELENLQLREQEKLKERLELKKKRPVYDPNDIDETGERGILSQYDEEIQGKKKKTTFKLDVGGTIAELADILDEPAEKRKMQTLDVDLLKDAPPPSDYLDASEIKVKKPKKKKSKSTRQRAVDDEDSLFPANQTRDDLQDTSMDIDGGAGSFKKKRKAIDESFVDDDDLQASLSLQRREALKKRKRTRPEDIAKQLREEAAEPETPQESGGLVIDEISEFVSTLRKPGEDDDERPRKKSKSVEPVTAMEAESSEDEEMEDRPAVERGESLQREGEASVSAEPLTGVEHEKTINQGMGATLQLLKERGLLEEAHGSETHEQFRQRQKFLGERNRLLAQVEADAKTQRERDRKSGLLDRMSARDREEYARKQNADREFRVSQIMAGLVKEDYKPTVNLKYIDEYGRELDQKEAFKFMSHAFHGRGSGKGKTEKKLKKIAEEKRRESQSVLDASQNANMTSATAQQSKKRREAGVRLA